MYGSIRASKGLNVTTDSNLEKLLRAGEFVVTAEVGPPKSADRTVIDKKASLLKGYADAFNVTDCQTSVVRMSSIAAAVMLMEAGLEPVVQMTCRDRNRIGMQSDILGVAALGAKNLLCLTGDHPKFGDHPGAKPVFDLDSVQLLHMVKTMRDEKRLLSGTEIAVGPRLFLGAAENPFGGTIDIRARRLAKKIAVGAEFFQTQIVYNVDRFAEWMKAVRDLGLHEKAFIIAGVSPLKSLGMARYMQKNVPGMDVPDEIIARMKEKKSKAEGIQICLDIIEQIRGIEGVAGVHIMAIEWEEIVPEIVERAGLLPRPTA